MEKDEQLVRNTLEEALSQLDAVRLGALVEVRDLQLGFHALLEQEASLQVGRLGIDHPRAVTTRAALDAQRSLVRELQVKAETAAIRLPKFSEKEALVHGRVIDSGRRGFFGLTVCLVDKSGDAVPGAKPTATDNSGHYAISLPIRAAKSAPFLEVYSPKGRLLFRSKGAVELAAGALARIDLTLDRNDVFRSLVSRPTIEPPRRQEEKPVSTKKRTRRKTKSRRENDKDETRHRGEDS